MVTTRKAGDAVTVLHFPRATWFLQLRGFCLASNLLQKEQWGESLCKWKGGAEGDGHSFYSWRHLYMSALSDSNFSPRKHGAPLPNPKSLKHERGREKVTVPLERRETTVTGLIPKMVVSPYLAQSF